MVDEGYRWLSYFGTQQHAFLGDEDFSLCRMVSRRGYSWEPSPTSGLCPWCMRRIRRENLHEAP